MKRERDALPAVPALASKETPIERIFQKIVGRKMTAEERVCLRLDEEDFPPSGNSNGVAMDRRKNGHKSSAKLTRH
jgi:hypothetical protein